MKKELEQLKQDFLDVINDVADLDRLEELRVEYLGRKGKIANVMKKLPDLAEDVRKDVGVFANEVKKHIDDAFSDTHKTLTETARKEQIQKEWIDLSLPGTAPSIGHTHLVSQAIEEITDIFHQIGFVRVRHPEVDWDYYAFESLNLPKDHPARDEWETFFVADGEKIMEGENGKVVLVPHTSNGQVREMEKGNLPIRMLNISKTYRRQSDISHAAMFHQFEGMMIDKGVNITHLKGAIDFFVHRFFSEDRKTRLRPHHFRFTEPSFEIDISCDVCKGSGKIDDADCRLCKEGWLEIGGSGMVHPNVIKAGGLDPDVYSGFAFGFGVERCMMMKSGVNVRDIRTLYRNDLRFLKQF